MAFSNIVPFGIPCLPSIELVGSFPTGVRCLRETPKPHTYSPIFMGEVLCQFPVPDQLPVRHWFRSKEEITAKVSIEMAAGDLRDEHAVKAG